MIKMIKMIKMINKKKQAMIIASIIITTMLAVKAFAGANLIIGQVTVDPRGNTFSTQCVNSRGYYFEIGESGKGEHLTVYGFGGKMPLKTIVNDLLFPGWKVHFGKSVDLYKKVNWMGHKPWTDWLRKLAFENNLAIILDWQTKTLYINHL